mmetsp:Transcript_46378/g.116802  ORF Transcript_46378/g.116802 Transcript_46378/m.116802 type:complete len:201 (+) Transcript_46378:110-712(+)
MGWSRIAATAQEWVAPADTELILRFLSACTGLGVYRSAVSPWPSCMAEFSPNVNNSPALDKSMKKSPPHAAWMNFFPASPGHCLCSWDKDMRRSSPSAGGGQPDPSTVTSPATDRATAMLRPAAMEQTPFPCSDGNGFGVSSSTISSSPWPTGWNWQPQTCTSPSTFTKNVDSMPQHMCTTRVPARAFTRVGVCRSPRSP